MTAIDTTPVQPEVEHPEKGTLGDMTFTVRVWEDPVIDQLGYDIRSHYVEQYWLGILGPSSTWLLRKLANQLEAEPEGFELHLADTARSLGLGPRAGKQSPFMRTIDRCCQFGLARRHLNQLDVRRYAPPLTRSQITRLPESIQAHHEEWVTAQNTPSHTSRLQAARKLALELLEGGIGVEETERHLHRAHFHPAVAYDSLRWATSALSHISTQPAVS